MTRVGKCRKRVANKNRLQMLWHLTTTTCLFVVFISVIFCQQEHSLYHYHLFQLGWQAWEFALQAAAGSQPKSMNINIFGTDPAHVSTVKSLRVEMFNPSKILFGLNSPTTSIQTSSAFGFDTQTRLPSKTILFIWDFFTLPLVLTFCLSPAETMSWMWQEGNTKLI